MSAYAKIRNGVPVYRLIGGADPRSDDEGRWMTSVEMRAAAIQAKQMVDEAIAMQPPRASRDAVTAIYAKWNKRK